MKNSVFAVAFAVAMVGLVGCGANSAQLEKQFEGLASQVAKVKYSADGAKALAFAQKEVEKFRQLSVEEQQEALLVAREFLARHGNGGK